MTAINFITETFGVRNEDLTAFHQVAEFINKNNKNINVFSVSDSDPTDIEEIHLFKEAAARVAGNIFVVQELATLPSYNSMHSMMRSFDGYEIHKTWAVLHQDISNRFLYFSLIDNDGKPLYFKASKSAIEEERSKAPTKLDYSHLQTVLDDFCIKITIPKFLSIMDMERWQRKVISSALA